MSLYMTQFAYTAAVFGRLAEAMGESHGRQDDCLLL